MATSLTLGLASLGFVSLGLPEGLLGVAWPSIRATFGLPIDALGMLLATFAGGYFVASAVSGRVLARFGVGRCCRRSCATTGLCLLGYALAPSWPLMVALGAVLGAGGGTIDAALNVYGAIRHGPRVLNWMHAAFGLGAAVGPLIMTAILSRRRRVEPRLPAASAWLQLGLAVGYGVLRASASRRAPQTAPAVQPTRRRCARCSRQPAGVAQHGLFGVYAGLEVAAGQWSYSLFTRPRRAAGHRRGVDQRLLGEPDRRSIMLFGVVVNHVARRRPAARVHAGRRSWARAGLAERAAVCWRWP